MEDYSILRVRFSGTDAAAAFCDLVNEYKDELWQETSKRLNENRMVDVSRFESPASEVFSPYVERLNKALSNPGIEAEAYRLVQNCTVSRNNEEVQLVVEGTADVERIAEQWVALLRGASPKVVSSVERTAKS